MLRRGGLARMDLWQGARPLTEVKWYKCGAKAAHLLGPCAFRHRYYGNSNEPHDDDERGDGVGPHTGTGMRWPYDDDRCTWPNGYPYASALEPAPYAGVKPCGSPQVWENGGRVGIDPEFICDANGVPACCVLVGMVGAGGASQGGTAAITTVGIQVGSGGALEGGPVDQWGGYVFVAGGGQIQGGPAGMGLGYDLVADGGQLQGGWTDSSTGGVLVGTGGEAQGGTATAWAGYLLLADGGQDQGGFQDVRYPSGGGYLLVSDGGQQQGDSAEQVGGYELLAGGGQFEGGASVAWGGAVLLGDGGQAQGGSAAQIAGYVWTSAGGVAQGGAAATSSGYGLLAAGGQAEGGSGPSSSGYGVLALGGEIQGGTASVGSGALLTASGGELQGGDTVSSVGYLLVAAGGQIEGGANPMLGSGSVMFAAGGQIQGGALVQQGGGNVPFTGSGGQAQGGATGELGSVSISIPPHDATMLPVGGEFQGSAYASPVAQAGGYRLAATGGQIEGGSAGTLTGVAMVGSGGAIQGGAANIVQGVEVALRGYIDGCVLSNDAGSPTLALDVAAGVCTDDTGAITLTLAATNKLLSAAAFAAGAGASGMDAAAANTASTWYYVFVIAQPGGAAVDVLFSRSATAPVLPGGYTLKRYIGAFRTDGTVHILPFTQNGDEFLWGTPFQDANVTNPGIAAVIRTLTVPPGRRVKALVSALVSAGTSTDEPAAFYLSSPDVADVSAFPGAMTVYSYTTIAGNFQLGSSFLVWTNASAQIRTRLQICSTGTTIWITTYGWIDPRGRNG
jgi:hypothetical protein